MQWKFPLNLATASSAVVLIKAVAVTTENRRDIQYGSVIKSLLDTVHYRVFIVLCFNHRDWNIGLVVENVISTLTLPARG